MNAPQEREYTLTSSTIGEIGESQFQCSGKAIPVNPESGLEEMSPMYYRSTGTVKELMVKAAVNAAAVLAAMEHSSEAPDAVDMKQILDDLSISLSNRTIATKAS